MSYTSNRFPFRRMAPGALVVLLALAFSWLLAAQTMLALVAVGLLAGVALLLLDPVIGVGCVIATLVIGQLIRIPVFGSEGAVLPNDLLIPALAAAWLIRGLLRKSVRFISSPLSWPIGTMLVVFAVTFVVGSASVAYLTSHDLLVAVFYIVRWFEYALLFFIIADLVAERPDRGRRILSWLLVAGVLLAFLGFIQLKFFPDFRFMVPQGWDPHLGRLLSTWFDPNFLGGFFVFLISIAAGMALTTHDRRGLAYWSVTCMVTIALVLTYSRSSYAAFIAAVGILAFIRSRRVLLVMAIVGVLITMSVPRIQERIQGALSVDTTAKLRIVSWQNALTVVRDHPFTGVGYNTYRSVQVTYGFLKDSTEHSAGGSDSSLLTILVTTGIIGLLTFLWILWTSLMLGWKTYRHEQDPLLRGLGLGVFAGMAGLVVHSFFINSLFYPHMMEAWAVAFGVLVGLTSKVRKPHVVS